MAHPRRAKVIQDESYLVYDRPQRASQHTSDCYCSPKCLIPLFFLIGLSQTKQQRYGLGFKICLESWSATVLMFSPRPGKAWDMKAASFRSGSRSGKLSTMGASMDMEGMLRGVKRLGLNTWACNYGRVSNRGPGNEKSGARSQACLLSKRSHCNMLNTIDSSRPA